MYYGDSQCPRSARNHRQHACLTFHFEDTALVLRLAKVADPFAENALLMCVMSDNKSDNNFGKATQSAEALLVCAVAVPLPNPPAQQRSYMFSWNWVGVQ